ncbi:MAG: hypothetical protein HC822_01260 [Oscillochloris sp.]|nr:hypothetical protein [Oscillochloris sp.]
MEHLNSGARPEALEHFADRSEQIGMAIAAEVNRLASALDHFAARCKEYYVLDPHDLPAEIREVERQQQVLAERVRMIASAFRNADIGGLNGLRDPIPPPSRNLNEFMIHVVTKAIEHGVDTHALWMAYGERMQAVSEHIARRTSDAAELTYETVGEVVRGIAAWNISANEVHLRFAGLHAILAAWVAQDLHDAAAWVSWNTTGLLLNYGLSVAEFSLREGGSLGTHLNAYIVVPTLLVATIGMVGSVTIFGLEDWAFNDIVAGDVIGLFERSFWQQKHYVEPELFKQINRRLDKVFATAGISNPRPLSGPHAEPIRDPERGVLDVSPYKLFPPGDDYRGGPYRISPGALMDGPHALISPYTGEQVSFARINQHEYVIGIYGLDINNISNSPNGLYAVALTAAGSDPEANPYYVMVRSEVLDCIKAMPPGSDLHFTGHSMGAGMVFTLLNDPMVLEALRNHDSQVPSATTLGGVRPIDELRDEIEQNGPGGAYTDVLGNTVLRHYNDPDDQLAINNGAGHDPQQYPAVIVVDDGDFDSPTEAHTTYENMPFEQLPEELRYLPWTVDPMLVEKYRVPPPAYVRLPGETNAEMVA